MQNLAQLRAKTALAAAPSIGAGRNDGKSVAKKVPAQIIQNGILGALAFAIDARAGYYDVFSALCAHLRTPGVAVLPNAPASPEELLETLSAASSDTLRAVTTEAMEYLSYLRRFAKGDKESDR